LKMKPAIPGIEEVKGINMVDFLSCHYGLDFSVSGVDVHVHVHVHVQSYSGRHYCCLSPFNQERSASFFVRQVDGHWLFKDFSSGYGGSLIDFILLKEGLVEVSEALSYIGRLLSGGNGGGSAPPPSPSPSAPATLSSPFAPSSASIKRNYDVESLYTKFRRNDVRHCRDYLSSRGICEGLINHLCERGMLVHNKYEGNSYCCFAVFDHCGRLRCLDNHQIGGDGKFVLGSKHPFSLDWKPLPLSQRVFVTESIIDYLSIKTFEGFSFRGLALLGNVINFNSDLFACASEIVSALDGDGGGFRAFLDLEESFSDRVLHVYDFGESKDANEYLQKQKSRKSLKQLSAQDKLSLYRDYQRSDNKSTVAGKWGINRSYMYEIVNECEELIVAGFSQRRCGRRSSGEPATMAEARERVASLEQENRRLDEERERYYVRNEFMKVRLKWVEHEAAELRGAVSPGDTAADNPVPVVSKNRKKQIKKKKRRKW
jgi:transposase-like protein